MTFLCFRGSPLRPASDVFPSLSFEEKNVGSASKSERQGSRKIHRNDGETKARSFEASRRPGVPDTTVGMMASGGGRIRRQEMWSRKRSWSVNDCLPLPSSGALSKTTKPESAEPQRSKTKTLGSESEAGLRSRLEALDLSGVKISHKRPTTRACAVDFRRDLFGGKDVGGLARTDGQGRPRPARLSLPAAATAANAWSLRVAGGESSAAVAAGTMAPATAGPVRRQRHSVAGWRPHHHQLGANKSGTACVFSTAVISGAASAPNLTDIIPNTASVSEGCGGVPPIRPLETLHNALSLRQIDSFLERMARGFKTPASTPPRQPGSSRPTSPSGLGGWSDPPSFVSTSGASSPAPLPEFFLAQRLQQSGLDVYGHRDSIEVAELYNNSGFSSYPQSINNEGSEDERYFYEDSESDPHETDTTVVPSEDQTRAKLSDIAWPRDGDGDTQISAPKSSGRFTCTSVGEEVQLVTTTSSSVSTGFSMDPPTTPTPTTPIPTPTTPSPATIGFFPPEVAPITSTISDDIPAIPRDRIDSSEDS
ncbi:Acid_phosphat_A [Nesidiocoris tenuis]|uniref:Acid_phosphat_A n=1 Tax=Nesidiocoris tenuis TaxID=355587 RepID=A0ABN7AR09_9HEMI|nr:Acid_phosphat_A [Nesidiocoris tenuis]